MMRKSSCQKEKFLLIHLDNNATIKDLSQNPQEAISLLQAKNIFDSLVKKTLYSIEAYSKEDDTYLIVIKNQLGDGEVFMDFDENGTQEDILNFSNGKEKLMLFRSLTQNSDLFDNTTITPQNTQ